MRAHDMRGIGSKIVCWMLGAAIGAVAIVTLAEIIAEYAA